MEELGRVDSVSESDDSTLSFLLTTEDSRTTSSSSGSSGEIPSALIDAAVVPRIAEETNFKDVATDEAVGRENCVGGRRNRGVTWGMTCVQGRRKEMEDAVSVKPAFMSITCNHVGGCSAPGSLTSSEISPLHFFGVYDGHGGDQVAKFCSERMHKVVAEEWDRGVVDGCEWQRRWESAFSTGFERTDNEVLKDASASDMVGSTAVVAVLSGCQIITSNCGDSRAVLFRGAQSIPLTVDQKPDREDELTRIEAEGGKVINWDGARVFGVLAMSRAIGDWYLRPWIIPVPEITFMPRSDEDECLILGSDGLWDVMSNDEVGEVARRVLRRRRRSVKTDETLPAQAVADALTEIAYGRNSSDNISIIVVDLKSKRKRQPKQ